MDKRLMAATAAVQHCRSQSASSTGSAATSTTLLSMHNNSLIDYDPSDRVDSSSPYLSPNSLMSSAACYASPPPPVVVYPPPSPAASDSSPSTPLLSNVYSILPPASVANGFTTVSTPVATSSNSQTPCLLSCQPSTLTAYVNAFNNNHLSTAVSAMDQQRRQERPQNVRGSKPASGGGFLPVSGSSKALNTNGEPSDREARQHQQQHLTWISSGPTTSSAPVATSISSRDVVVDDSRQQQILTSSNTAFNGISYSHHHASATRYHERYRVLCEASSSAAVQICSQTCCASSGTGVQQSTAAVLSQQQLGACCSCCLHNGNGIVLQGSPSVSTASVTNGTPNGAPSGVGQTCRLCYPHRTGPLPPIPVLSAPDVIENATTGTGGASTSAAVTMENSGDEHKGSFLMRPSSINKPMSSFCTSGAAGSPTSSPQISTNATDPVRPGDLRVLPCGPGCQSPPFTANKGSSPAVLSSPEFDSLREFQQHLQRLQDHFQANGIAIEGANLGSGTSNVKTRPPQSQTSSSAATPIDPPPVYGYANESRAARMLRAEIMAKRQAGAMGGAHGHVTPGLCPSSGMVHSHVHHVHHHGMRSENVYEEIPEGSDRYYSIGPGQRYEDRQMSTIGGMLGPKHPHMYTPHHQNQHHHDESQGKRKKKKHGAGSGSSPSKRAQDRTVARSYSQPKNLSPPPPYPGTPSGATGGQAAGKKNATPDVFDEVRKMHKKHDRILGELNLDVEAMIMPRSGGRCDDMDNLPVGPTDELLSPECQYQTTASLTGAAGGPVSHQQMLTMMSRMHRSSSVGPQQHFASGNCDQCCGASGGNVGSYDVPTSQNKPKRSVFGSPSLLRRRGKTPQNNRTSRNDGAGDQKMVRCESLDLRETFMRKGSLDSEMRKRAPPNLGANTSQYKMPAPSARYKLDRASPPITPEPPKGSGTPSLMRKVWKLTTGLGSVIRDKKSSVPDLTFGNPSPSGGSVPPEPEYALYDDAHRNQSSKGTSPGVKDASGRKRCKQNGDVAGNCAKSTDGSSVSSNCDGRGNNDGTKSGQNGRESTEYEDIDGRCLDDPSLGPKADEEVVGQQDCQKPRLHRASSESVDGEQWGSSLDDSNVNADSASSCSSDGENDSASLPYGQDSFRARILKSKSTKKKWKEDKKKKVSAGSTCVGLPSTINETSATNNFEPVYHNGGAAGGDPNGPTGSLSSGSRFTRWFSWRRDHTGPGGLERESRFRMSKKLSSPGSFDCTIMSSSTTTLNNKTIDQVDSFVNVACFQRQQPPSLPPQPAGLTAEQVKRRHIINSIVQSENSYVSAVQRLVKDYKKALEDSNPPIISTNKVHTLFYRIPEILQIHTLFRIELAECVRNWDKEERIGDVFVSSFSRAIVLDMYSDFINNFTTAMDLAKLESKRKSAFADFLKVKQITSTDRLSFFGLMVKPVQRFPQFILQLQDLLKYTPHGHPDRHSLQLALTQLESLADLLNERKRETEQLAAFRETMRHLHGSKLVSALKTLPSPSPQAGNQGRFLLREDNMTQLEFNNVGLVTKTKPRRLYLLNDLLVCVSTGPKQPGDFNNNERLSLKWAVPVNDVEVQDTSTSPTLSRVLTAGLNKNGSLKSDKSESSGGVESLCQEMSDLMHDFELMRRISSLISQLKGSYAGLNAEAIQAICSSIQQSIQQKDEEIAWVDSCCLQFTIKTGGSKTGTMGYSGPKEEQFTFQTDNPTVKKDWIVDLRLAQLALDANNSPAWDIPEQEQRRPAAKLPLFVKSLTTYASQHQTEVRCGCYYSVPQLKKLGGRVIQASYLWVAASDGVSTHLSLYAHQSADAGPLLRPLLVHDLQEVRVTAVEHVPGFALDSGLRGPVVWMGTESRKIMIYSASEPERMAEVGMVNVPAPVTCIKYHCDMVWVGLANASILVFRRDWEGANPGTAGGEWLLKDPHLISLNETGPVTTLLPLSSCLYVACDRTVAVIDGLSMEITRSFNAQHEDSGGRVNLMAHSGIGLWISMKGSPTICLYHTETFKHLQDINVASNVARILGTSVLSAGGVDGGRDQEREPVHVTALMACRGLLWIGTNVGMALTIPLPRLEGIPIISGRANISFHAHSGPVTFLLPLQSYSPPSLNLSDVRSGDSSSSVIHEENEDEKAPGTKTSLHKQNSDGSLTPRRNSSARSKLSGMSPVALRRRFPGPGGNKDSLYRRTSKTLPRGLGLLTVGHALDNCDVYGLYGELMNIRDYEDDHGVVDPVYETMRRSDPDLSAVPNRINTLDRRLQMKTGRPRSLDLSNWSMDSKNSSHTSASTSSSNSHSSSSDADNTSLAMPSVSRMPSFNASTPSSGKSSRSIHIPLPCEQSRTLITITGGRGYINIRRGSTTSTGGNDKGDKGGSGTGKTATPLINYKDAHIMVWEIKA